MSPTPSLRERLRRIVTNNSAPERLLGSKIPVAFAPIRNPAQTGPFWAANGLEDGPSSLDGSDPQRKTSNLRCAEPRFRVKGFASKAPQHVPPPQPKPLVALPPPLALVQLAPFDLSWRIRGWSWCWPPDARRSQPGGKWFSRAPTTSVCWPSRTSITHVSPAFGKGAGIRVFARSAMAPSPQTTLSVAGGADAALEQASGEMLGLERRQTATSSRFERPLRPARLRPEQTGPWLMSLRGRLGRGPSRILEGTALLERHGQAPAQGAAVRQLCPATGRR